MDVVACGSMEEGTRVHETDETKAYLEFDYLAVLKSFPDSYQLRFRISLSGCMEILRGTRFPYDPCCPKVMDFLNCVRNTFRENCTEVATANCLKHFCAKYKYNGLNVEYQYLSKNERPYGCGLCTVHIKNGYVIGNLRNTGKLNLLWVCNEIETNFSTKNIDVDFHPVILVNPGSILPPYGHPNYIIDSNLQYYLFPGKLSKSYPGYWSVSVYRGEVQILQSTPEIHRAAYVVVKYLITKNFLSENFLIKEFTFHCNMVDTYEVKTAVLHHIKSCDGRNKSLLGCIADILDRLTSAYINGKLQHYFLRYNLLSNTDSAICVQTGHIMQILRDMLTLSPQKHIHIMPRNK